ncbi:MAG: MFS transporter [Alistipes sp.]
MKPTNRKWYIVATMFIAIICNYLDRQLLSILKPEILDHFGIGNLEYAWIVNVFLICYATMYPISGILVDKFGPKRVMLGGITIWSLACIGGGMAPNVTVFAICRGILGLAEPTIFAGQLIAVTMWFEKRQRATANSLCTNGGSIGAVIAPVVIAWLMGYFDSWQHVFYIAGITGLVIALVWQFIYTTPPQEVIEKTVNADKKSEGKTVQRSFSLGGLFRTKTLWGGVLIRLISDPVWYFCCFWLPGFLRTMGENEGLSNEQTLNMIQWIGGIPFLVGAAGGILTSMWSDVLIRRGMEALRARKKVLITMAFLAPFVAVVPFVSDCAAISFTWRVTLVIVLFCIIAVLCNSWLYTAPVTLVEQFPIKNAASVMGICCGAGALGSVVFNQFVGSIPESAWTILFCVMGTLHLIAAVVMWRMVHPEKPTENC